MFRKIFLMVITITAISHFTCCSQNSTYNANIDLSSTTQFGMALGGNIAHSGENFGVYPGSTFDPIKKIGIKTLRIHDSKSFDWDVIFPNWNADPNSPDSYDFKSSDRILQSMFDNGFQPFIRLGASVGAVTNLARMGTNPPDVNKWCTIANNIIGHYVNGWGNGHRYALKYVEIWNEPDIGFWKGDQTKFNQLSRQIILLLKKNYPQLKVGLCGISNVIKHKAFADNLLAYLSDPNGNGSSGDRVPIDFFSWHVYEQGRGLSGFKPSALAVNRLLAKYGYSSTKSICTEYNAFLPSPYLKSVNAAVDVVSTLIWAEKNGIDGIYFYPIADNWGLFDIKRNASKQLNFVKTNIANSYVLYYELTDGMTSRVKIPDGPDDDNLEVIAARSSDNKTIKILAACSGWFGKKLNLVLSNNSNASNVVCEVKELSGNGLSTLNDQNVISVRSNQIILNDNIKAPTCRLYTIHLQ